MKSVPVLFDIDTLIDYLNVSILNLYLGLPTEPCKSVVMTLVQ